ncbi:hypothetical protein [Flavobacterium sp. N1718]|uniref:hypothetical protein n=1 Tax=Flavobacterium sp. N1718 TaxID=2986822 RepID=UPI00222461B6|nr:hypothetical protein [Flavobacterium sp. N1718]
MRSLLLFLSAAVTLVFVSCRSDFEFSASKGDLRFSRDTVYLDTVFRNIGSSTYNLKVYNRSDDDISIPTIGFRKGQASKYRMTVDGLVGDNNRSFENVELLAHDSLYIFIEVTADVADTNPADFLYTDQIVFDGGSTHEQTVELVTLIQDAYFIYPGRNDEGLYTGVPIGVDANGEEQLILGRSLQHDHPENGDEFIWGADKPYVVYGFASVPDGENLTIQPGARVHFHAESGLIVQPGGSLNIAGELSPEGTEDNEVIFEGDRLEPLYSDVPGQWGFVYLRQGSAAQVRHLTSKNGIAAFVVEPDVPLDITDSKIFDHSNFGILSRGGTIDGRNLVINNAGQYALALVDGGNYRFNHCTFNNDWPSSQQSTVLLKNYTEGENAQTFPIEQANFDNCIIYGSNQVALALDLTDADQPFLFNHCLIRFNSSQLDDLPEYDFTGPHYNTCIIAPNSIQSKPDYKDRDNNELVIGQDSAAKEKADPATSALVPQDIDGKPRPTPPATASDIGAYQSVVFE